MNLIETQFPITEVVAYPASATIARTKKIAFKKGENRIRIKNLPEMLSLDTVRIETGNRKEIAIVDICVEDSFIETYDENRYRTAKEELDTLTRERQRLEAAYRNCNEEFLLFINKESLVETVKRDNFRSINVKNWSEFFSFLQTQLTSNRNKARETVFKWLEINRKIETAQRNLVPLESYDRVKEHTIAVTVNCLMDVEEEAALKYMAPSVSWYPAYSIRADLDTKEISVALHAMVSQATGEDWSNISLLLSTAIPLSSCDLPELKSQRIKEKSAEAVIVPGVAKNRALAEEAADGLTLQSEGYKDKKADVYEAEEKNIPVQRLQRKGAMKKEKCKSAAPPAPKSIVSSYAAGGTASMTKKAMEISQPSAEQSTDEQFFGGMAEIDTLVRDVETRVFESIPISDLVQYYRDYDSFAKDRFSPEDIVPGTSDANVNPAFVSGISPLASMGGFDYRYELGGTVDSIRSTGTPIQIGVDIVRFPLTLTYIAVPLENEAVYLKASFKNTYRNPFPQGPAQVFSGNNFLGNVMFPTVGRNEQTSLSLGIDRDIKIVRREKAERKTGGFVKKEIVTECRIEIELVSYKDTEATVDVYERIPISEKPKEVEVAGVTSSPKPFFVTERNVVIFRIVLPPREKKKIEILYSLKHPEDFRLTLRNAGHPHYDSEGGQASWRR